MVDGDHDRLIGEGDLGKRHALHLRAWLDRGLHDAVLVAAELHQGEHVAQAHALANEAGDDLCLVHADIHAVDRREHPGVCRVVDARDDAWHRELHLGQHGDHEVDLVLAGDRGDDVGHAHAGALEHARVRGALLDDGAIGAGAAQALHRLGALLDDRDGLAVGAQLRCQMGADLSAARNDDLHSIAYSPMPSICLNLRLAEDVTAA